MNPSPPQLFEPAWIGGMHLANRLVRSATWEGMCTAEGRPTPELIALYRDLARGGVGLITTGFTYVSPAGKPLPGTMGLYDDAYAAEMRALCEAVHGEGGKIIIQLGHAGGQTRETLCGGQPAAPSAVAAPQYQPETPREMTMAEIEALPGAFAAAALRARRYGFDGVQLHAAHGYLLNQFLSPHTNRRTDAYGGDLQGRSRLLLGMVGKMREVLGPDFPLLIKLTGSDYVPEGLALADAVQVAAALDAAGVDAIEVSSGTPASGDRTPLRRDIISPDQEAYNLPLAKAVKQAVRCPVMVVGGIRSLWTAKRILRHQEADFISLARPLVHEPSLPQRWRRADGTTLSLCNSCNGCFKTALKGNLRCVRSES